MSWLTSLFGTRNTPGYAALNQEQRYEVVSSAPSVQDLDTMWAAWEARGQSRQGLLYAAVLERKRELGALLSAEELEAVRVAAQRRVAGAALPSITGRVKGR